MKVSNDDKILIGAGAIIATGIAYIYWSKKKAENAEEPILPEEKIIETKSDSVPQIDKNKLLRIGSKGIEVKELQKMLGVQVDGDFGKITLKALQQAMGVEQTSLNQFDRKTPIEKLYIKPPTKPFELPKVGTKLMVAIPNATLYKAKKIANASYTNTGETAVFGSKLAYGESAGIFQSATVNGTYLVQLYGTFYFINGKHVRPY